MKQIARILAVISLVITLIAFIPLLGWVNWFGIPMAIFSLIFAIGGKSRGATIICIVAIFVGIIRLSLGGGIF